MTSAPADLLGFRADVRTVTGLGAVEVGIAPDPAHLSTGGYHVGVEDIQRIGRWDRDYSTRQRRDRLDGTNTASAVDIGDNWPRGGRAAWLRFNNLLYAEMRDHPERLPALRAINVSLDGTAKRRYDQMHRADGLIVSKDTVDSHTHLSFWRDTIGRRKTTLDRIVQLARTAITGNPQGDDMQADERAELFRIGTRVTTLMYNTPTNQWIGNNEQNGMYNMLKLIAEKTGIDPAELAQIEAASKAGAAAALEEQRTALAAAVVAALPQDRDGNLTVTDVETAVRAVFADAGN